MIPAIDAVKHINNYRIWIHFTDGSAGEVDLQDELWGEMFEPLRDLDAFAKVRVDPELGTIVWPNGADLAPEFLYSKITQRKIS